MNRFRQFSFYKFLGLNVVASVLIQCTDGNGIRSDLDEDIFLRFKNGNAATIFRQNDLIVFKLCKHNTNVFDRDCDDHTNPQRVTMPFGEYKSTLFTLAGIDAPYNTRDGYEMIKRDIAEITNDLDVLSNEERFEAERSLDELRRALVKLGDANTILSNLDDGFEISAPDEVGESKNVESKNVESNAEREDKPLILNEVYRTRLFSMAFGPFSMNYPNFYLPPVYIKKHYWLDTQNGTVWQKLPGTRNWYDAANRTRTVEFYYPIEQGCESTLGNKWRLPSPFMLKRARSNGISILFDVTDVWTFEDFRDKFERHEVVCMANFEEVYLDDDYDSDGIPNKADKCHMGQRGFPVDDKGCEPGQKIDNWVRGDFDPEDYWLDPYTGKIWRFLGERVWHDAMDLRREVYSGALVQPGCKRSFNDKWKVPDIESLTLAFKDGAESSGISLTNVWSSDTSHWNSYQKVGHVFTGYFNINGQLTRSYKLLNLSYKTVCMADLLEVHPNGDYDNDGVINKKDRCHAKGLGQMVEPETGCEPGQPVDLWGAGASAQRNSTGGSTINSKQCRVNGEIDSDCDGVVDRLDKCPGTKKGLNVWKPGQEYNGKPASPSWYGCTGKTKN